MSRLQQNLDALKARRSESTKRHKNQIKTLVALVQQDLEDTTPADQELSVPGGPEARRDGIKALQRQVVGRPVAGGGDEAEELWNRLQRMLKDAPHKITPGARSRDYATQVRLWNAYKAGKGPQAARPGTSKHGNGRANDLQYSSPAARAWALANAKKYGLHFPIYNPKLPRSRDESWHIELLK